MSDLERLNEALKREGVVWRVLDGDHDDYTEAHAAFAAFAALVEEYRDLLANGVEPDYEAAVRRGIQVTGDIDGISMGDWRSIVDAAIGDRLLINPPTEEE